MLCLASKDSWEEDSRRWWLATLGGRRPALGWDQPAPFQSLMTIFSIVDKFRGNYALESLFLAFLKFTLENTEYAKLVEIIR